MLYQVAFSPDGRRVAAASAGHGVDVFDRATGQLLLHIGKPTHVYCLAFSPNGKLLAAPGPYDGKKSTIRLFDVETGREMRPLPGATARIMCLAFSPDG